MRNKLVVLCVFGMAVIIGTMSCGDKENSPANFSDITLSADGSKNDLPLTVNIIDECPNENECPEDSICEKGENLQISGIKSFCTKACNSGFQFLDKEFKSDLDDVLCDDLVLAGCCGKVMMKKTKEIETWCLPAEFCCDNGFSIMCGEECCPEDHICHEKKEICVDKPKCHPDNTNCKYTCCFEHKKCTEDGEGCELKCQPPSPVYCKNECCPNNYSCECEDQGGFCLPEGAEMCNCEDQTWCDPLQKCIENNSCYASGKTCKPLGAEDCPESDECYCNPGMICTHALPACCPSGTPVPCDDYCCPAGNTCSQETQDCLPSGWVYCEKWGIKCGVGQDCNENEPGCKDNQAEECGYGNIICSATETCVGEGNGINGCCPTNQEVPCAGYCCPSGTHCEEECGGCVIDGYFCCSDGQTTCLETKICWSNGSGCLDTIDQDCGSYMCNPNYACSSGPQQCCPSSKPKTCGSICCHAYEICYEADNGGFCVDDWGDEEYCGNFFKCPSGQKCVAGKNVCIPDNAEVCSSFEYCDNMQCCQECVWKCTCDGWPYYTWFICDNPYEIDECHPICSGNFKCATKGLDCMGSGYCPSGYESRAKLPFCSIIWYPDEFPELDVCCLSGSPINECGCSEEYQISIISYKDVPDASFF